MMHTLHPRRVRNEAVEMTSDRTDVIFHKNAARIAFIAFLKYVPVKDVKVSHLALVDAWFTVYNRLSPALMKKMGMKLPVQQKVQLSSPTLHLKGAWHRSRKIYRKEFSRAMRVTIDLLSIADTFSRNTLSIAIWKPCDY